MTTWLLAVWIAVAAQAPTATTAASDLSAAKGLYASGSYEEALATLARVTQPKDLDEADQYRALCLLALGRSAETEQALESLIRRNPLYRLSEDQVSPRVIQIFRSVRARVLPDAARALYTRAKAQFDEKKFADAAESLRVLQNVLDDADVNPASPAMRDMKLLADGFLRLADAEIKAAGPTPATATPATSIPPPAAVPAAAAPAAPRRPAPVYSSADADVTPPVELARTMPPWRPPNAMIAAREHRGLLRIVIDEGGRVESALLVRPVAPSYDASLVGFARQWQFKPALKDGVAVKYSKDIPIVLAPVTR